MTTYWALKEVGEGGSGDKVDGAGDEENHRAGETRPNDGRSEGVVDRGGGALGSLGETQA
jgi:hypothetical protein